MIDRRELRDALLAAGLPPDSFQLPGIHDSVPLPTDFWFLRPASSGSSGGWELGSYERGSYDVREVHAFEPAACTRLYRILVGHG